MRLPFTDGLIVTTHFDAEMAMLADRHYSRRTVGARQFLYSGRKLVLRNAEGTVLFGWVYPDPTMRMDDQRGYNCAIFRNESKRKASEIILEAEQFAVDKWGPGRMYTYIDPAKTASIKTRGRKDKDPSMRRVGFCYLKAGWKPLVRKNGKPRLSKSGQHLLVKLPRPDPPSEVSRNERWLELIMCEDCGREVPEAEIQMLLDDALCGDCFEARTEVDEEPDYRDGDWDELEA